MVAIIDILSQAFYFWLAKTPFAALSGGLGAALVWLVRKLATLPVDRKQALLPKWLPIGLAVAILALALLLALAVAWATLLLLLQKLLWNVAPDAVAAGGDAVPRLLSLVLIGLVPTAVDGWFPEFINLSTLQAFYSARLTRAYLGASNGARFLEEDKGQNRADKDKDKARGRDRKRAFKSAAVPHPDDAISRKAYYDEHVLVPLHLINVTMDLTVDPTEQLVQRDRKGLPLAVGPAGYLLDGEYADYWEGRDDFPIGEWVGISGAAFTTGLGRATTFGLSLLLGLANVRLGVWWRSKLGANNARNLLEQIALRLLPTQTYLAYELTAHFHGRHRKWQYLSDGGHFENTAAYELLRPQREVAVIVVCDDGCDQDYRFADVANLIRLARIDHRAQFTQVTDFPDPDLGALFGRDEDFAKKADAGDNKCALLYRVSYPDAKHRTRWLIVLKPRLVADAPLDVWQYGMEHATFPQESTTDQFFDEAQWESYRKLGVVIGTLVFGGENGAKLVERLKQGA